MAYPANFFTLNKPKQVGNGMQPYPNYGTAITGDDSPAVAPYSSAIFGGVDQPLNPVSTMRSVSPPNVDMTANLATPQSIAADRQESSYENPPVLNRQPIGTGSRIVNALFGRFTRPIAEQNGVQSYQDALQNYNTQLQAERVPTEYGDIPLSMAKNILPAEIRAGSQTDVENIKANSGENIANTNVGGRKDVANINAGASITGKQIGADARIKAAQLGLGPIAQVPQDLQDQLGLPAELPLKFLNQAESAANRPLTIVNGENGPAVVNKAAAGAGVGGTPKSLGLGNPTAGRVVQAADPNNPGQVTYSTAGNAVRNNLQSPQSATTQAAKSTLKSATSGKIGDEINAFSTANQHADLLQKSLDALNNGDNRTLNSLKNSFKTEFGSPDVTNFQAIANAYSREITKMVAAGHLTDSEIASSGATLPTNASPQQILGALNAYKALATSKLNIRKQQVEQGLQGKPNFPGANADPLGIR